MAFGRKGLGEAQPAQPLDGRAWVKERFESNNQPGSMEMTQALGQKLFDQAYHWMKNERGVRIEDITAMLASVGGQLCIAGVLEAARREGKGARDLDLAIVSGKDGFTYYFGDAPNWLLCEAPYSLISLLFGAAHQHGAPVSIQMLHDEMRLVAQRVGGTDFLDLDLPAAHQVDSPLNWAKAFTAPVANAIFGGIAPPLWRPVAVGFALQQAIDLGRQSLEPMMLARIALQCAVRAAKIDPARIAAD